MASGFAGAWAARQRDLPPRGYVNPVAGDGKPILWHLPISHYSEKVRWALAYKGLAHERRTPPPGVHMLVALRLTRGRNVTFPLLELEGRRIGDSSAIIAALEERFPEPPLYPSDPEERRRALALEEFFDEELGPYMRRLVFHSVARDPERITRVALYKAPPAMRRIPVVARGAARAFVALRYRTRSSEGAEAARRKVLAALDRLESELGSGEYLVGDRFGVADLTAASLLYALVLPPEGPKVLRDMPEELEPFRAALQHRPGTRWVADMFRRHRGGAHAEEGAPARDRAGVRA